MTKGLLSRRVWVQNAALTLVAITGRAWAAAGEQLNPNDADAAALGYVKDAAQVDPKKFPLYAKGSTCENCLRLQGSAGPVYRPCETFDGKLVAVGGWCKAWAAEM